MLKVFGKWSGSLLTAYCKSEVSNSSGASFHFLKKLHTSNRLQERSDYSHEYYYNMSSKHLATGSSYPLVQEKKLRMLSMRFCPYAQRAILVAIAKDIPHDVVNCNLKHKAEWLVERNPNGKVPTLELGPGKYLYESLVVSDYLDETFPNNQLRSSDPFQRAIDGIWVAEFSKGISAFYKTLFAFRAGDMEAMTNNIEKFKIMLKRFNEELAKRGTKFFGREKSPGMLDYMIWPWIERLPAINSLVALLGESFNLEKEFKANSKLVEWAKNMEKDPAVKEFLLPTEIHIEFLKSFLSGSPNYDLVEEEETKSPSKL